MSGRGHRTLLGFPAMGLLNLLIIYGLWSSTFLLIKIVLGGRHGVPPFLLGAVRMLCAGAAMIAIASLKRQSLRVNGAELRGIGLSSLLIWGGGGALLVWGMGAVSSGMAAIITASIPAFTLLLEHATTKKPLSASLIGCLVLGFGGLLVIVWPAMPGAQHGGAGGIVAVVLSSVCCALGFCLQRRHRTELPVLVVAGYQLIVSACLFAVLSMLCQESMPDITRRQTVAWAALTVVTAIGVMSFSHALRTLPIGVVMTYAYVNPVIGLLLGWLVLDERMSATGIGGAIAIVVSVAGLFNASQGEEGR